MVPRLLERKLGPQLVRPHGLRSDGLGRQPALPSWGVNYSYSYSNPYYVASATPAYDYSQPIVINTYNTPTADASATSAPEQTASVEATQTAAQDAGYRLFDSARTAFQQGDYSRALSLDEQAIQQVSDDPVLHEFGALCLFALGDYDRAAAVLNALLAVAPGMDWATMSSLYEDTDTYTQQLRKLEAHTTQQPDDTGSRFVLAYHYLVLGQVEAAVEELKAVVAKQPEDRVATRMLEALSPEEEPEAAAQPTPTPSASGETTSTTDAAAIRSQPPTWWELGGRSRTATCLN